MKIPHGITDFGRIRSEGYFYIDKTMFLPLLESGHFGYPLLHRPRGAGKSTLVSMLEHYYDLARAEQFDQLFEGLWIHRHPTPERARYLVLRLDLSGVSAEGGPEDRRRSLFLSVWPQVEAFVLRYRDRIPRLGDVLAHLDRFQSAEGLLGSVLDVVSTTPYKAYVLIDDYDRFVGNILAEHTEDVHETIAAKTGFVRALYATLKSCTRSGEVWRIFITGALPINLNDFLSGFNIGCDVSDHDDLNTLAGFTRKETERAVDEFLTAHPTSAGADRGALLDILEEYYGGYRFSRYAEERVFNPSMVLHFLQELGDRGAHPVDMLDRDVRAEYEHLQHLGPVGGPEAVKRRSVLRRMRIEGQFQSDLVQQLGVPFLDSEAPFISLLYFLGMLTRGTSPRSVMGYDLRIPNRAMRDLVPTFDDPAPQRGTGKRRKPGRAPRA